MKAAPILVDYAMPRRPSPQLPGYYSAEHSLWVVSVDGVTCPLVALDSDLLELTTKTSIRRESDDHHYRLELTTKTDFQIESEDLPPKLTEALTKTESGREGDESMAPAYLLTKTEAKGEGDESVDFQENRPPLHQIVRENQAHKSFLQEAWYDPDQCITLTKVNGKTTPLVHALRTASMGYSSE